MSAVRKFVNSEGPITALERPQSSVDYFTELERRPEESPVTDRPRRVRACLKRKALGPRTVQPVLRSRASIITHEAHAKVDRPVHRMCIGTVVLARLNIMA